MKILGIILALYNSSNGAVLIDEIEDGFHYKSLRVLWDAVIAASREFNVQVFAATHSIECLRALQESCRASGTENSVKLYRIEKEHDITTAIDFDSQEFSTSLLNEWEVR